MDVTFTPATQDAIAGWFHSGDLGVMTEAGYLSVVDRKKDMIKTGGESVASREVEETIYELDEVHAHAQARLAGFKRPKYLVFTNALTP
jgi:fatty-acyl-CoA synthase